MGPDEQRQAGCVLGQTYPLRIVDHDVAAREARARLTDIRKTAGYGTEAKRVFVKHGSRKRRATRNRSEKQSRTDTPAPELHRQLTLDFS